MSRESDNKKFTHPLSGSPSLICPRAFGCYLNSSRTDRPTDRDRAVGDRVTEMQFGISIG